MTGKRASWKSMPRQLRMDPKLADAINEIAAEEFRQPNEQILLWICQGVESYRVKKRGGKWEVVGRNSAKHQQERTA